MVSRVSPREKIVCAGWEGGCLRVETKQVRVEISFAKSLEVLGSELRQKG
jgi:hypothetical protein